MEKEYTPTDQQVHVIMGEKGHFSAAHPPLARRSHRPVNAV